MIKEVKKEIKLEKENLTKESRSYNKDKPVKSEKESRHSACDEKTFREQKEMKQLLPQDESLKKEKRKHLLKKEKRKEKDFKETENG